MAKRLAIICWVNLKLVYIYISDSLDFRLIETLGKSPQSLFVTELINAQNELIEVTKAGFKLYWLKSKLEDVSLERKKAVSDGSQDQQLEECGTDFVGS
ncbi:predicted protein [Arabidopsis lyrata subsp. lyrata]|uniref:Predicted protein n=1 Tax=Arabidopsis lyrata subsp. lyrata TaxID=81972 RepID=D7LK71_ARALL|nr:predicted protein [Arabidopsis lyrata subsp. lyrata]